MFTSKCFVSLSKDNIQYSKFFDLTVTKYGFITYSSDGKNVDQGTYLWTTLYNHIKSSPEVFCKPP